MKKILIVEDEIRFVEIIKDYLEYGGYDVFVAMDGKEAIEIFKEQKLDLIILDIMLPKLDGFMVCEFIRKRSFVPIIMLSALSEEENKLKGFELGIDEYVTKPFSPKVLLARVNNLLKRIENKLGPKIDSNNTHMIIKGSLIIDKLGYSIKIDNKNLILSNLEYRLILYLVENENIVLTRDMILDRIWGIDYEGNTRVVDTQIKNLRKKLDSKSNYIKTIIGTGYKFEVCDG